MKLSNFPHLIECCMFVLADMGGEPEREHYTDLDCPLMAGMLQIANTEWEFKLTEVQKSSLVRAHILELDPHLNHVGPIHEFILWFLNRAG